MYEREGSGLSFRVYTRQLRVALRAPRRWGPMPGATRNVLVDPLAPVFNRLSLMWNMPMDRLRHFFCRLKSHVEENNFGEGCWLCSVILFFETSFKCTPSIAEHPSSVSVLACPHFP